MERVTGPVRDLAVRMRIAQRSLEDAYKERLYRLSISTRFSNRSSS